MLCDIKNNVRNLSLYSIGVAHNCALEEFFLSFLSTQCDCCEAQDAKRQALAGLVYDVEGLVHCPAYMSEGAGT